MTRSIVTAALVLAAAVAHPTPRVQAASQRSTVQAADQPAGAQQFQFRGVVFTIPAGWSVERGDQRPFRSELVRVTGQGVGPQLTFSDTVQPVGNDRMPAAGPRAVDRSQGGLVLNRFEMPNPLWRGVVYVLPEAGISVSAQARTEVEARAAEAVVQSARRALPSRKPARS
jgi:hypothetical protein